MIILAMGLRASKKMKVLKIGVKYVAGDIWELKRADPSFCFHLFFFYGFVHSKEAVYFRFKHLRLAASIKNLCSYLFVWICLLHYLRLQTENQNGPLSPLFSFQKIGMTDCPPFFLFLLFFTPFPAVNASTTVTEKKNSTKDDTGKTSQANLFPVQLSCELFWTFNRVSRGGGLYIPGSLDWGTFGLNGHL